MTDTTAFTGANSASTGKGLTIDRIYTTPGVHPYDQVEWEYRDVVQTNWKNGEVIFEQRGAEFPTFWSINASTIVTTKYFRGALGTNEREYSLRQLINRVVRIQLKEAVMRLQHRQKGVVALHHRLRRVPAVSPLRGELG